MGFPEAENRILAGKWVCLSCGAVNYAPVGRKPSKCRKCKHTEFRLKHKKKK